MGNTVRTFSSLGTSGPCGEEEDEQEKLGDALEGIDDPKLGDLLTGMFDELDVDSVEEVRELREDT